MRNIYPSLAEALVLQKVWYEQKRLEDIEAIVKALKDKLYRR